jgi:hypothetical protein
MMEWQSEEFGPSHEGRPAAVLADGSEPKPVYFDIGSGANGYRTSDWWVYDGTLHAPLATALRAACSCGWRGTTHYPITWDDAIRRHPHLFDTSGPEHDWDRHIADVEARSIPLPENLTSLLDRLEEELDRLASDAPLAALKAVAILERATDSIAHRAALTAEADVLSWEAIATALGLTPQDARARLTHYALRL